MNVCPHLTEKSEKMKFKEIRQGGSVFAFNRDTLEYVKARVESVSAPYFAPNAGAMGAVGKVIDIVADLGKGKQTFVVGEDNCVNYLGSMAIAADSEQIKIDVENIKTTAEEAVRNYEKHKEAVEKCSAILAELDPRVAETKRLDRLEATIEKIFEKLNGL